VKKEAVAVNDSQAKWRDDALRRSRISAKHDTSRPLASIRLGRYPG